MKSNKNPSWPKIALPRCCHSLKGANWSSWARGTGRKGIVAERYQLRNHHNLFLLATLILRLLESRAPVEHHYVLNRWAPTLGLHHWASLLGPVLIWKAAHLGPWTSFSEGHGWAEVAASRSLLHISRAHVLEVFNPYMVIAGQHWRSSETCAFCMLSHDRRVTRT